ncbi:MAG: response regulator [Candidatus Omnitrophota bacterium]|nr:response regulator [Candidatus Omnitrophota bacterium]
MANKKISKNCMTCGSSFEPRSPAEMFCSRCNAQAGGEEEPKDAASTGAQKAVASEGGQAESVPAGNHQKILLIEDDASYAHLMEFDLRKHGYEVTRADNGREGFDRVKAEKPDLILMDVLMPEMTGYELLAKLKVEVEGMDKIPVIVMSARKSFKDYFPDWAVFAFLDKAVSSNVLLTKVAEALGNDAPPLPVEETAQPSGAQEANSAARGKLAVVVAAEDFILESAKKHLESLGFSVINGVNESGVLKLAKEKKPELILGQFWEDTTVLDIAGLYRDLYADEATKKILFGAICPEHLGIDAVKSLGRNNVLIYSDSKKLIQEIDEYLKVSA